MDLAALTLSTMDPTRRTSLRLPARAAGMGHGAACAAMIGPLARRLALAEPLVRGRLGYLAVLSLEASLREAAGPAAGA